MLKQARKTRTQIKYLMSKSLIQETKYNNINNSIQLFIIYVPSEQLQGQLQIQHSDFRIIIRV
jgi:hypothetical protein